VKNNNAVMLLGMHLRFWSDPVRSSVVEAARRRPQTVTKHGKPAVVVVDVVEYERLRRLERRGHLLPM
jgi:prevent-host-death family protein